MTTQVRLSLGLAFIAFLAPTTAGQKFSGELELTGSTTNARCVTTADLDGDGDLDALFASRHDSKVAWYENLGGGSFGTLRALNVRAVDPSRHFATDLDGDGNPDVLAAFFDGGTLAWYENLGGRIFGEENVLSITANGATSVYAADLDADGDMGVLSSERWGARISYRESIGGGQFTAPRSSIEVREAVGDDVRAGEPGRGPARRSSRVRPSTGVGQLHRLELGAVFLVDQPKK